MKISTEINSLSRRIGEEKAIEWFAKAGFDAWDFSMFEMCGFNWDTYTYFENDHPLAGRDYLKFARQLKKVGLDNGIICNQSHAPFPSQDVHIRTFLKRAIECTAEAGGEICVIHPDGRGSVEKNTEMYLELLPFAKECGVKIATENMYGWDSEKKEACFAACGTPESINAHLDAINDEFFVACLDIGHAEMRGMNTTAEEMVRALGSRLKALHIHDNDKRDDRHAIPFSMDIDFVPIVKALKDIKYDGYFTLEVVNFLQKYTDENLFDGVKEMAAAAKKLADMYEGF